MLLNCKKQKCEQAFGFLIKSLLEMKLRVHYWTCTGRMVFITTDKTFTTVKLVRITNVTKYKSPKTIYDSMLIKTRLCGITSTSVVL